MPSWGYLNAKENIKTKSMDTKATRIGNKAEQQTMKLLDEEFGVYKNICVFHDLRIPTKNGRQWEPANMDHMLLTITPQGTHRAIMVDSKAWKSATYKTKKGATWRGKEKFSYADSNTLDLAASRYQQYILPPNTEWWGVVAVWPQGEKRISLRGIRHENKGGTLKNQVIYTHSKNLTKILSGLLLPSETPDSDTVNKICQLLRKPKKYN